ncbi:TIR domain-containing protein [Saccharopolyspora sp. NPDC047091]|uniref:TIR domain-containing protein n=1 Tax=Saccharopolyspora sp. NPDC047091 TaxID=3155924 RepID=UPI0033D32F0D
MHEVFVNYRTGDAEIAAAFIAADLRRRFGADRIFFDGLSIKPGRVFPPELLAGARRCRVLLVLIGPHWRTAPGTCGGRALDEAQDWIRREIVVAAGAGAVVLPMLVGREVPPLGPAELPPALRWLAERQHRRFDPRDAAAELDRLAADLVDLVPVLASGAVRRSGPAGRLRVAGSRNGLPAVRLGRRRRIAGWRTARGAERVPDGPVARDGPRTFRDRAITLRGKAPPRLVRAAGHGTLVGLRPVRTGRARPCKRARDDRRAMTRSG